MCRRQSRFPSQAGHRRQRSPQAEREGASSRSQYQLDFENKLKSDVVSNQSIQRREAIAVRQVLTELVEAQRTDPDQKARLRNQNRGSEDQTLAERQGLSRVAVPAGESPAVFREQSHPLRVQLLKMSSDAEVVLQHCRQGISRATAIRKKRPNNTRELLRRSPELRRAYSD